MSGKNYFILFLILIFHLFLLSQLQFTVWPEMVSFPYLINNGMLLYKDAIHVYPPLLVGLLSVVFKFFGYKLIVLELFGWITILFSDVLFFLILQKIINKKNLVIYGVVIYAILQTVLEGNMVWPDLFIVPFLLLTFLFLTNRKYFLSGVAIGLAILIKQTGVLYLVFCVSYIVLTQKNYEKLFSFIVGGLLAGLPFLLLLLTQNSLMDFINWAIVYPSKYWTKFPGYVQLYPTLRENVILLILIFPFAFLIFRSKRNIFADKHFLLLFGFLIAGILGFYPRFSFFHLQSGIAFLVITIIYLISKNNIYLSRSDKLCLLIIPILVLIVNFRSLQFGEARFWTNKDIDLGQIIKDETPPGKPIYLLGLNSNLYAYADRLPNKPWLDNFGWYLEIPDVQNSVIKSFEQNRPSTIFWQDPIQNPSSQWYDIGTYQPKIITDYITKNYLRVKEVQKGIWEWKVR